MNNTRTATAVAMTPKAHTPNFTFQSRAWPVSTCIAVLVICNAGNVISAMFFSPMSCAAAIYCSGEGLDERPAKVTNRPIVRRMAQKAAAIRTSPVLGFRILIAIISTE